MRDRWLLLAMLAVVCAACATATHAEERTIPARRATTTTTKTEQPRTRAVDRLCAFRGLGTWVDVYDTEAAFADGPPPIRVAAIARMHAEGVHTLYLQVAKDDPRSAGVLTDPKRAGEFLVRAHELGIKVVAWYLPTHRDPALDSERAVALAKFRAHGQQFDGLALDIEGTTAVPNVAERNRRLLATAAALDGAAGSRPVGAIVYPPVATDVLNPALWPDFPWKQLAAHVDIWLPMAYWTFRSSGSLYRDPYRYGLENIERIRAHVGKDAAVHLIGGIADTTSVADEQAFMRAARDGRAIGASLYDFNTMRPGAWTSLQQPAPHC
jgi:hypothetical protein